MKTLHKNYIAITFLVAALSSCGSAPGDGIRENLNAEESPVVVLTQAQYDQAQIVVGQVGKLRIGAPLKVNGIIDVPPQGNISITLPYGGFVARIKMLPGTEVKKGQVLVTIKNPEFIQFQQDYLESLADQSFLKDEFERQEKLFNEQVASAKTYQQSKSNYLANEAKVKSSEARLRIIGLSPWNVQNGSLISHVNIISPINGSVREVYTNVGSYVHPQDVIMDITDAEDLHVELSVYEDDIPKIKTGQLIRFQTENQPDVWNSAEVFLVGKNVREDRSVTVHGHLKQHYDHLLPGMYVSAQLETESEETWAIEENSIVRYGGREYVFAYQGVKEEKGEKVHAFEMTEIIVGNRLGGYVGITLIDSLFDLSHMKFVTQGAFTLLAKAKNTEESGGDAH